LGGVAVHTHLRAIALGASYFVLAKQVVAALVVEHARAVGVEVSALVIGPRLAGLEGGAFLGLGAAG
nr:hypothetical protein [Tanacetum cinerariifolium]